MRNSFQSVFAEDLSNFIQFRLTSGRNPNSAINWCAGLFDQYCVSTNIVSADLTSEVVLGWFEYEQREKRNVCRSKLSFIRGFGKYLAMLGRVSYVLGPYHCKKIVKQEPLILTDEEIGKLFAEIDKYEYTRVDTFATQFSFPALCRLLFACGLRPGEGLNLRRSDIDYETGEIYIRELNKSHTARTVVAKPDVIDMLKKHDERISDLGLKNDYMFIGSNGNRITRRNLEWWLRVCWRRANPDIPADELKNIRPYDFRHNFATISLYELGKNIPENRDPFVLLRSYMGHKIFDSTFGYMHLCPERTARSYSVVWDKTMETFYGDEQK